MFIRHKPRAGVPPFPVMLMVRELGIGGCENDLTKLARSIDRSRFLPHVGCLYPNGIRRMELDAAGVPILQLPITSMASPSWFVGARLLGKYIRNHEIRLVHTFDAAMDMVAVPIARYYRVPVVIKSHLGYRDAYPSRFPWVFSVTDRMVDGIIVNSLAVQEDLAGHGVPSSRTHLCYNGVDVDVFHPGLSTTDDASSMSTITIGTVCALRAEKRVDWLLDAFARVRHRVPAVRLLVVGSGPMREHLEQQRHRLELDGLSHFEPTTTDVAKWMRRMDVFILTSQTESFPNALLEAMACGRCVIASRVGGVPEMVSDGENGLLFEPGNIDELTAKVTTVLQHDDLRRSLGAAAARTVREKFSIARNVQCIEHVYESLLGHVIKTDAAD